MVLGSSPCCTCIPRNMTLQLLFIFQISASRQNWKGGKFMQYKVKKKARAMNFSPFLYGQDCCLYLNKSGNHLEIQQNTVSNFNVTFFKCDTFTIWENGDSVKWGGKRLSALKEKKKDRLCLAGDRQRDRWDTRLSLWGLYRATVQGVMWTTGTTGVESCNDTPSNSSDSHFENIITIYHTLNHPLRAWECAWVCVWDRQRKW